MAIKFSKPVLTGKTDSSYKPEYTFDINITNSENAFENDGKIHLKLNIVMNSNNLRKLIDKGIAIIAIKAMSAHISETHNFNYFSENVEIIFDPNNLKKIDSITLTAYVIANTSYIMSYNDELYDVYQGYDFDFHKGEILAQSNIDKLDYNASGQPFIKVVQKTDQIGFRYNVGENILSVLVSPKLNEAFHTASLCTTNINPSAILNSFIAFTSITNALLKVAVEGVAKYEDTEWFKALDYNFVNSQYNNDLSEYLNNMKDDLDSSAIDSIFETVQEILNNGLEKKIIASMEV